MLYETALLISLGICSWLALSIAASDERRRFVAAACLALCVVAWCAGELLLAGAVAPDEVAFARRVLFFGVCAFGPCWLWLAAVLGAGSGRRAVAAGAGAVAVAEIYFYGHLWWGEASRFVDLSGLPAQHGPLFAVHTGLGWLAIVAGLAWLVKCSSTDPRVEPRHRAFLMLAVLGPLAANVAHVGLGSAVDPTPIVLGGSAVVLRATLLRSGLSSFFVPFGDRALLDRLTVGLLVADRRGVVLGANERARRILGSLRPEGRSLDAVLDVARNESGRRIELHRFALDDPDGRAECALLAERVEPLGEKVEVQKPEDALAELCAGLSHEVNNPLTYLTVNLHLLGPLVAELGRSDWQGRLPARLGRIAEEGPALLEACAEGTDRIRRVIESLEHVAQGESDAEFRHLLTLWRSGAAVRHRDVRSEDQTH
ncbi:MAG: histidine kinase N-terminal 7TM domain-containing protein [Myxococcota bacterium]